MELSKRLLMVASMVEPGSVVADVGCDHGFVSIYLVKKGICPRVLAMDVNAGPLERAKEHVQKEGLAAYIDVRPSDGLAAMKLTDDGKPEADTLLLAGLGGRLAARILKEGYGLLAGMRRLILQPQSELWLVREAVREIGYSISDENMIEEDGKFYTAICAENEEKTGSSQNVPADYEDKEAQWQRLADCFGPCLISSGHPVLRRYLEERLEHNRRILETIGREGMTEKSGRRARQLQEDCALMEEALRFRAFGG